MCSDNILHCMNETTHSQLMFFSLFPQRDKVDAVSLDATHAFIAGGCGLVPVVTEYYGKNIPYTG